MDGNLTLAWWGPDKNTNMLAACKGRNNIPDIIQVGRYIGKSRSCWCETTLHEEDNKTPLPQLIDFIKPTNSSHDRKRKSEHHLTNIRPQKEEKGAAAAGRTLKRMTKQYRCQLIRQKFKTQHGLSSSWWRQMDKERKANLNSHDRSQE